MNIIHTQTADTVCLHQTDNLAQLILTNKGTERSYLFSQQPYGSNFDIISGSNKSNLSTVCSYLFFSIQVFMKWTSEIRIKYNFCKTFKTWQHLRKILDHLRHAHSYFLSLCVSLSIVHFSIFFSPLLLTISNPFFFISISDSIFPCGIQRNYTLLLLLVCCSVSRRDRPSTTHR